MKENKNNFNVGLIGFGMAGRVFHAPFIHKQQGFTLTKIRESKAENILIAQQRYPEASIVSDAEEIFKDKNIDMVVIATPNVFHFPLAKEALQAGKHVVLEKPFTNTTEEADELITLAKRADKLLTVFHNRRFDSDFRTVQRIVERNLLGNIKEMEIHYDRYQRHVNEDAWRMQDLPGSGILYDLGSHLIDQAVQLFGLPEAVMAHLTIHRAAAKAIDDFEVSLYYERLKVTIKAGTLVREPRPRYILNGEVGSFVKYGLDVQEEALKAGGIPGTPDWGKEPETIWGKLNTECQGLHIIGKVESERGDYSLFYQNLWRSLTGGETIAVRPEDARNVIRLIELAIQSHKEKKVLKFK
jgi:scyllo-inositol 2-dehydrogenase (NADP+)